MVFTENVFSELITCIISGEKLKSSMEELIIKYHQQLLITPSNLHFALLVSIVHKRIPIIQLILSYHHKLAKSVDSLALKHAACLGNLEIVKLLVDNKADIHASDDYCLQVAASNGHNEVVEYLLQKGASISAKNNNALMWAFINNRKKTIDLLIQYGADPFEIDTDFYIHNGDVFREKSYFVTIIPSNNGYIIQRNIITRSIESGKIIEQNRILETIVDC